MLLRPKALLPVFTALLLLVCAVNAVVLPRGTASNAAIPSRRTSLPLPPPNNRLQTASRLNASQNEGEETEVSSQRNLVGAVALSAIAFVATDAKLGLLPGPLDANGASLLPYSGSLILQDMGVTVLTATLGYVFVKIVTTAGDRGLIEPRDSRKIIHTLSAPLFMLFWPLFSPALGSKFFAAIVPSLNAIRLYLASTGSGENSLRKAVSRSGDANEALGGPFIYVCILAASILFFWRSSPVGIVALSCLAAGDGLADLIGRRLGANNQWPGLKKSVAGSLAFWAGSLVTSVGLLLWMQYWGCLELPFGGSELWLRVAVITLGSAILELVPIADDNYTVPFSAALLTMVLLQ
jgi:phytol kinase